MRHAFGDGAKDDSSGSDQAMNHESEPTGGPWNGVRIPGEPVKALQVVRFGSSEPSDEAPERLVDARSAPAFPMQPHLNQARALARCGETHLNRGRLLT